MQVRKELRGAAQSADEILRRIMPREPGCMSYSEVAKRCGCTARTPRTWLFTDGEIRVPEEPARSAVAAIVTEHEGDGASVVLLSAWAKLLGKTNETIDPSASDFSRADVSSASTRAPAGPATGGRQMPIADRRLIVEQATVLLEETYAHLLFKRSLHAVDPVRRLRLLDFRLSQQKAGDQTEVEFHREMIDIFNSFKDLHTTYVVPNRFRSAVMLLPFRVEQYFEKAAGRAEPTPAYIASKVSDENAKSAGFVEGSEITHWNGVAIHRAIEVLSERQAAGNQPASFGRALDALTLRPLLSSLIPDEQWVDVTFIGADGASAQHRFTWATRDAPAELMPDHLATPLGLDAQTHAVSTVRKEIYGRLRGLWSANAERRGRLAEPMATKDTHVETHMPWLFRAHPVVDDRFGYIRIFSFGTKKPTDFIEEFARLASLLPSEGLIVDLRGNAGGSIIAAEGCLQVLSPERIRPSRAQFATSPLLLDICERNRVATRKIPLALEPWIHSLRQAVLTGSAYSQGFPITDSTVLEEIDGWYDGPVAIIVDALCYSATDIFAAGFADHELGAIIGTSDNTGAGGGNVWRHRDLVKLAGDDSRLKKLPGGVDFRVAVRRTTRVHGHEGQILEDLGIEVSERHYMTRNDIFEGNRDLIATAAKHLTSRAAR